MLAVFGAIAAFIFVCSGFIWLSGFRGNAAEARLGRMHPGGGPRRVETPFGDRVMMPAFNNVTGAIMQVMPHRYVERVSLQLLAAGATMTPGSFFAVLLTTTIFFPVAFLALLAMSGTSISFVVVLLTVAFAFFGFLTPLWLLRTAVNSRRKAIWKQLADAFDLITVCVEAGLGLDAALRQVAEKLKGPLASEIAQVLREVAMGRPRREALEDMASRTGVRELETFVHAVVQAEQLGTSLGRVLRAQAISLRVRRRQRAQEVARRAPVKMVFPLVLLIMPTFFIITLGPMFIRFVNYLSN